MDAKLGDAAWADCAEGSSWEQISAEDVEVGTVWMEEMSSVPIFRNIWRERKRERVADSGWRGKGRSQGMDKVSNGGVGGREGKREDGESGVYERYERMNE